MKRNKSITCPYCGRTAVLRKDDFVYGERGVGRYLYVCSNYPECDSYVGVHEGTKIPLGTLANSELRNMRIRAHKILGMIWDNKLMSKKETYRWIEYVMGLPKNEGHIGLFSEYRCKELMNKCKEILNNNNIKVSMRI